MRFGEARRGSTALQRAEHDLLFRTHYPTVVTYLAGRVPKEDAKDLAADVFVEAWRQRERVIVDEDRGWLPWLFTVARNMAAAWWASRKTRDAKEAMAGAVAAPVDDFIERIVEVQAASQVLSVTLMAMTRLCEEDREILELCGLYGFTPAQAAISLELPVGTTRVRLHRARHRLAELVAAESNAEEVS